MGWLGGRLGRFGGGLGGGCVVMWGLVGCQWRMCVSGMYHCMMEVSGVALHRVMISD